MPFIHLKTLSMFLVLLPAMYIIACSTTPKANHHKVISYTIEPGTYNNKDSLKFTLTFSGDPSGATVLVLPGEWAGNQYTEDIFDLKVAGPTTLKNSEIPHQKILHHLPNAPIEVSYQIIQTVEKLDKTYKSIVTQEYFHFIGYGVFVLPDWNGDQPAHISLQWKNFPKKFNMANSFGSLELKQSFIAKTDNLLHSIFVGGDYRVKKIMIRSQPLYIAIRGTWQFSDDDYFKLAGSIVEYQRNFFDDHTFDYFLITATPNGAACCSTGGTGLTNSFATFIHDATTLDVGMKHLLSHELFHTWNGQRIRKQEPEQLVYWFSEGFTDYYARQLLLRAGQISLEELVDDYNATLYEYYVSKELNAPNSKILKDFWKNYDIEKLPYRRGHILAYKWNTEIKTASNGKYSMDTVLKDLFNNAKSNNMVISADNMNTLIQKYNPKGIQSDLKNFIDEGKTIVPGEQDLGPCLKRKISTLGDMDLGYDRKATYQTNIITGLKKTSNAYKAGLRNGYKLLDRKVNYPPFTNSRLHINDGKHDRWIEFMPMNNKKHKVYHYTIDETLYKKDPARCLSWFLPN